MARGIIEGALKTCDSNQFAMILIAGQRAKMLENGAVPLVPREGSGNTVLALKEIAAGYLLEDFLEHEEGEEDELED